MTFQHGDIEEQEESPRAFEERPLQETNPAAELLTEETSYFERLRWHYLSAEGDDQDADSNDLSAIEVAEPA